MARKNLLKGLIDNAAGGDAGTAGADPPAPAASDTRTDTRVDPGRPRYAGGAIGAVSQSIAELKSRSVIEIDPFEIEAGGLADRLDDDDADHAALVASIRDHGQQVPVLVRPHPEVEGRYQIVYGRRRVLALRDLKQPVKALVRRLDDHQLVLAQGQENSARKDLTFIEKANFARQMRDLGYDRKAICAALHVDKTVISRMLSVADRMSSELIEAIGAAPSIGRDRWLALAEMMERLEMHPDDALALVAVTGGETSDARFEGLVHGLTLPERNAAKAGAAEAEAAAPARPERARLTGADGRSLGHAVRKRDKTVLTLAAPETGGFSDWLVRHLPEIHRDWLDRHGE